MNFPEANATPNGLQRPGCEVFFRKGADNICTVGNGGGISTEWFKKPPSVGKFCNTTFLEYRINTVSITPPLLVLQMERTAKHIAKC